MMSQLATFLRRTSAPNPRENFSDTKFSSHNESFNVFWRWKLKREAAGPNSNQLKLFSAKRASIVHVLKGERAFSVN